MSDIIQLLPDSVANQIAAGEVIQRPASVIKELVENAIDAGATKIDVIVIDSGKTRIQVVDNGCGMSATDARLSFERHATSKIRKADDLFSLHTMGFRGEALASIAAVAQVELRTRQEGEELGTSLSINGSQFEGQEPCSCPVGSNFVVNNIFYNVPARRRFLKSNSTELNNIITAFERIVLVYPNISFTLRNNDAEIFNLKAVGLRQRIIDVFGKRLNQELLPLEVDTVLAKITGFVGKPTSSRKKGAQQYFFVNNRYMKHPYFHKAVQNAYDRLVPVGEQVPYFIYFDVPTEGIDVNIHPTKTEIKFENEQEIWQILLAAVKDSVGLFSEVPKLDFAPGDDIDIPVYDPSKQPVQPQVKVNPQFNPFGNQNNHAEHAPANWEDLYAGLTPAKQNEEAIFDSQVDDLYSERAPAHYQYKGMYIMTAVKSGLMIIDQHRAHMRVLFEQYKRQIETKTGNKQKLLFPDIVHLSASGINTLSHIDEGMRGLGFEFTDLGHGDYAINSIPAGVEGMNAVKLVEDIIATAAEQGSFSADEINTSLAMGLARDAAIPYGQVLNNAEIEDLVNGLFACSNPNYTPDGKKVISILAQQEIERILS
ncbi:MAG: DNA mismatch repair endonuclease MutL [Prevotella sp.]|nr:DNA mismatch repair endonuclease MutL [Prevotella sp.]